MSDEADGGLVMAVRLALTSKGRHPSMGKVFVRILPSPSCAVSLMVQSNSDLISSARQSRW